MGKAGVDMTLEGGKYGLELSKEAGGAVMSGLDETFKAMGAKGEAARLIETWLVAAASQH